MADNRRLTVYQNLSKRFGFAEKNNETSVIAQSYKLGVDREILRTSDKEEFETKKKEYQQQGYLKKIWGKVTSLVKNQVLINETKRIPSYLDYDAMDEYPLIGAALDIFMEESTTQNEKGKILNIYSNSPKVKRELEILFEDRLNLPVTLPMIARNTCKYGDNFMYIDIDPNDGVIGWKELQTVEMERHEGSLYDYFATEDQGEIIFRWRSSRSIEFKDWQVAHFRLLTDERRLPYGVSILEKARRIWRNLLLTEDAMRTIRLIRAADRRAFYINVGNIETEAIRPYVDAVADTYKRRRHVDPNTGQEDIKMNVMGVDQDYIIPIRGADDGSKIETIAGQTNLDIVDIEYDLKLLCAALRAPKTYLNFEEAVAEGKSLSMQDIRFARTVNRIQQALLQELNKVAQIHLVAVGLEEELGNFSLTLNNPSIQSDILRIELLSSKLSAFKDATEPNSFGIAPMSLSKAKKEILGMSNDEILLDIKQQRLERAIGFELMKTEQIIQRTGIFDAVDKLYGVPDAQYTASSDGTELGGGSGGGGGALDMGDMGGMDNSDLSGNDLGGEDVTSTTENNNIEGPSTEFGTDAESPSTTQENIVKDLSKLLVEIKTIKRRNINKQKTNIII